MSTTWDIVPLWPQEQCGAYLIPTGGDRVTTRTIRDSRGVTYEVFVNYENGTEMVVWRTRVLFGKTKARQVGGADFRRASRRQDDVTRRIWLGVAL